MWVQRVGAGSEVPQVDDNDVPHFSPQDGAQEAQPGWLGDLRGVGVIRVAPVHGLFVKAANPVRAPFQEQGGKPVGRRGR